MAPQAVAHADAQDAAPGTTMKRRGLIAGAAALVAGMVAKQTAQPVAANTDGQALVIAGLNSESSAGTSLTWMGGTLTSGAALSVGDGGNSQPFTAMVAGVATGARPPSASTAKPKTAAPALSARP